MSKFGVFETAWCGSVTDPLGWVEARDVFEAEEKARVRWPDVRYIRAYKENVISQSFLRKLDLADKEERDA